MAKGKPCPDTPQVCAHQAAWLTSKPKSQSPAHRDGWCPAALPLPPLAPVGRAGQPNSWPFAKWITARFCPHAWLVPCVYSRFPPPAWVSPLLGSRALAHEMPFAPDVGSTSAWVKKAQSDPAGNNPLAQRS